jgi:tRNA(fMet)-specific endonuclease VapC
MVRWRISRVIITRSTIRFRFDDVLDYTQATAAHHGRLIAHVRRSGFPCGMHDLIIAAYAADTGRTILSRDAEARSGDLPGVSAIDA